mgnify:CR=1 FL=1
MKLKKEDLPTNHANERELGMWPDAPRRSFLFTAL